MIKMISIDKILSHPDNPRKDLGNITELSESIKESGILQNLTVVELIEGTYQAIIGHRRLAAARLAGLTEVPCSIAEMDEETQIATMLLENMQRSDLTVYEQAQGFQMMLDLGSSVAHISEKTGFSETTVRRRTKLLELDQEKLQESVQRGVTLEEYMKLSKIKDIDRRNEVLEHAGTNNFGWHLRDAITHEKKEEIKKKLIEKISAFATDIETLDEEKVKTKYVINLSYSDSSLEKEVEIEDGKEYVYKAGYWSIEVWENIYGQPETDEERRKREQAEERRAEEAEIKAKIDDAKTRTENLRDEFVYSLTNTKLMKYIGEILLLGIETRISFHMWDRDYIDAFKLEVEEEDFQFEVVDEEMTKRPVLSLLKIIYSENLKGASYFNFRNEYYENKVLDKLYDLLEKLGYEMSEEEIALQNGTHELFVNQ